LSFVARNMPESRFDLSLKDRILIQIQKYFAWLALPLVYCLTVGCMRLYYQYKIDDLQNIRKTFKALARENRGRPLMICANHLTKIDSLIIMWALGSFWDYFFHFKTYAWNLPEKARFHHKLWMRIFCYLGCCIAISRGGDRDSVQNSLNKIVYLLKMGHVTMIFPEGKRSLTGKIDTSDFSYGVGRLVQKVKDANVLCVYLRGRTQTIQTDCPQKGDKFHLALEMIKPKSEAVGLRGAKDLATQIIHKLSMMEESYFVRWE